MVHDFVHVFIAEAPSTSAPTSVVGLIIITVPATITAVALLIRAGSNRHGRPQDETPPPLPTPVHPLNSDELDNPAGSPERVRIGVLEKWLWRNRFDPTKIHDGSEAVADVRIV